MATSPMPAGDQNLVVGCVYALADGADVVSLLLGQVGDTDAAGQIDEDDVCVGLALEAHGKLKEDAREFGVVVVGDGVAGKECVDAKVLGALGLEHAEGLEELLGGHAVLGVAGVIHDAVGELEQAARIKAAADRLGNGPRNAPQRTSMWLMSSKLTMAPSLSASSKSAAGVSLDENMMSWPVMPSERAIMKLGIARAIAAAAVFVENGDECRVGIGLDGKVFLKARVPCEGVAHLLHVAADARLVI